MVAVALVLVIEGIIPFLSPAMMRATMHKMAQMEDSSLRLGGFASMCVGVVLIYLIK